MDLRTAIKRYIFNEDLTGLNYDNFIGAKYLKWNLDELFPNDKKRKEETIQFLISKSLNEIGNINYSEAFEFLLDHVDRKIGSILEEFFHDNKVYYTEFAKHIYNNFETKTEAVDLSEFKKEYYSEIIKYGIITEKYDNYLAENVHNVDEVYASAITNKVNNALKNFRTEVDLAKSGLLFLIDWI